VLTGLAGRSRWRGVLFVAIAVAIGLAGVIIALSGADPLALPPVVTGLLSGPGLIAALCALLGASFSALRERIPLDWRLLAVAAAAIGAIAWLGNESWTDRAAIDAALALALAYATIYLAFARLPQSGYAVSVQNGWYGIFLYAYPIQQAWMAAGANRQHFAINFALSLPVVIVVAVLSWHLVEKRLLAPDRWTGPPVPAGSSGDAGTASSMPIGRETARARRRSLGWHVARIRRALPYVVLAIALLALAIGVMAMTIFALQRDTPGM